LLQIENLKVNYPDGKQVLYDVSFRIEEGETIGIIGANGAGKSTLLTSIVGLLFPISGRIIIDGIEVNKKNLKIIRERIGIILQNPDDQLFMPTVYDDIAFGLRNYGVDEKAIQNKIEYIMKTLDIERLKSQHTQKLSGGEKRIVAIATVLAMEPSVILFDEPSSFLDPKTRRNLMKLLKSITTSKLIATHDLDMALDLCDKVIVLKDGKVFVAGPTKEILTNEELLLDAGLELPYCLQNSNYKSK
jgi:cobalt/nickel transport system ATP-binding protein